MHGDLANSDESKLSLQATAIRAAAWPMCLLLLGAHLYWSDDGFPFEARLWCGTLGCMAVLCLAYAPVGALPVLGISLGHFYVAMGAASFYPAFVDTVAGPLRVSGNALTSASLGAVVVGATALTAAAFADRLGRAIGRAMKRNFLDPSDHAMGSRPGDGSVDPGLLLATLSFLAGTAIIMGANFGSFAMAVGVFGSPLIFLPILWDRAERLGTTNARAWFWAMCLLYGVAAASTGMLGLLLFPGIVAGALVWSSRGKLPIGLLSVGVAVMLVLNPIKGEYRRMAWLSDTSFTERIVLWGDAVQRTWLSDEQTGLDHALETTARRMNALGQVAHMFDWVPGRIPHAGPERWLRAPLLIVPRFLWADKPVHEDYYNKDYTHTFRIQSRRKSRGTSITLPIIGDGFWRLGWTGVAIEGLVLGVYLGLAQGISRIRSSATLLLAVGLLQLRPENHSVGSFNGTLQRAAMAVGVSWLLHILCAARPPIGHRPEHPSTTVASPSPGGCNQLRTAIFPGDKGI